MLREDFQKHNNNKNIEGVLSFKGGGGQPKFRRCYSTGKTTFNVLIGYCYSSLLSWNFIIWLLKTGLPWILSQCYILSMKIKTFRFGYDIKLNTVLEIRSMRLGLTICYNLSLELIILIILIVCHMVLHTVLRIQSFR